MTERGPATTEEILGDNKNRIERVIANIQEKYKELGDMIKTLEDLRTEQP